MIWIDKLGGRRFFMAMGCGFATTLLCWFGKIDGGTYSVVIIATVGAYIAGDVVQKRNDSKADVQKTQINAGVQP